MYRSVSKAPPPRQLPSAARQGAARAPLPAMPFKSALPTNSVHPGHHATPKGVHVAEASRDSAHNVSGDASGELGEVIRLLAGIRRAMGATHSTLAIRLATTPSVIAALESGTLAALPAWPETRRIVDMWVAGAGLDPRPALNALAHVLDPRNSLAALPSPRTQASTGGPQRVGPPTSMSPAVGARQNCEHEAPSLPFAQRVAERCRVSLAGLGARIGAPVKFRRPLLGWSFGLLPSRMARWAAVVLIVTVIGTSAVQTKVVAAAISKLPAPAERAVRSISDFFAVRFAPQYQGHRWIEVDDPRSRRGDKLRIDRHSD